MSVIDDGEQRPNPETDYGADELAAAFHDVCDVFAKLGHAMTKHLVPVFRRAERDIITWAERQTPPNDDMSDDNVPDPDPDAGPETGLVE
jgi:hypothetical protein